MSAIVTRPFLPFIEENVTIVKEAMWLKEKAKMYRADDDLHGYANTIADLETHFQKIVKQLDIESITRTRSLAKKSEYCLEDWRKKRFETLDSILQLCDYQLNNYINLINEGRFLETGKEYEPIPNPLPFDD
jgi:ATP-dependent protease HslVU (ClpYQ) peptidase subunit